MFFCLRSNLSNNIISALRPALKTDVENYIFSSEIGSSIWRTGPHIPTKNSQEYAPFPPPPPGPWDSREWNVWVFKPQCLHTNSPYTFLKNKLKTTDERSKHFRFHDHYINSYNSFSLADVVMFLRENWCWSIAALRCFSSALTVLRAVNAVISVSLHKFGGIPLRTAMPKSIRTSSAANIRSRCSDNVR